MKLLVQSEQRGIAMIIVMVTIFVLAMLAGGFALSMKVETKLARNASSEAELEWIGRSGVELARWILGQENCPYDSLNQIWAGGAGSDCETNGPLAGISLKDHKLGNGKYSITITDLERKFNINQAINSPQLMEQVFILMGADAGEFPAVIGAIQDWVDTDDDPHIGGAESSYYQGLNPPYLAKNGPIDDLSELLLIKGVTPEMFHGGSPTNFNQAVFQRKLGSTGRNTPVNYTFGLTNVFTPLSSGKININTASEQVLQLIPGIDPNLTTEIIRMRAGPDGADGDGDDVPLRSVGELSGVVGQNTGLMGHLQQICDVRSKTFEVEVVAEIGGYRRIFYAVLGRNSPKDIQVLSFFWRTP